MGNSLFSKKLICYISKTVASFAFAFSRITFFDKELHSLHVFKFLLLTGDKDMWLLSNFISKGYYNQ